MRSEGFTLIELLIVIMVIGILVAIAVPVLSISRQQARAVICGSNIKQILAAFAFYEVDNQRLPQALNNEIMVSPPGGTAGNLTYDRPGWWWFDFATDYSERNTYRGHIIKCPAKKLGNRVIQRDILCGNYGVNCCIFKITNDKGILREFTGRSLRTKEIPHPGSTFLIVDSGYAMIKWWHAADTPPYILEDRIDDMAYIPGMKINKDRKLWPGKEKDAVKGRHPARTVNVGFGDGHTDRMKADDMLVEKTDNGYKNLTPLWRPR